MELSDRKKKILRAIVDLYIRTAEPVASKTIAQMPDMDFSSATIRNEMAELTTLGYLEQPHTSAGRIPSPAGYRLYVDELMQDYRLSTDETKSINQAMELKMQEVDKVVSQVGKLVSQMTNLPAYAMAARAAGLTVKRFDLILADSGSFILVVMLSDSSVKNKLIRLPVELTEADLKLINMESVEVEQIEWLFYPFIPFGKVTIIQGDPGEVKTTMVLQIIAKLTKGEKILPEQQQATDEKDRAEKNVDSDANPVESPIEPVNVIYQTAEDGLGDTIKPRLLAAGADCSRVMVIDDNDQALTMMDARLEEAIIQTKARLVVLDPIQGFLGTDVDMHRANEIRPLMKRVAVLAEKYHCAIILIGHMNKNSNGKSSYRGLGSIDFQAAARSVLIVGRIKDEPEIRVVCHVKSSLAPEGKSIAFRLDKDTGFEWIGEYDISADDLLSGDNRGQKIHVAKEFLQEFLVSGSVAQTKVAEEAEVRGIKKKTLWNAKKELEIDTVKIGNQSCWK